MVYVWGKIALLCAEKGYYTPLIIGRRCREVGENRPNIELYRDGSQLSLLQPTLLNNPRTVSELYCDGAHSYIPGKNYIRVHYLEL